MADSILKSGEVVHVITRRLFEDDLRRHFIGTVLAASDDLVRVQGYTFVFNPNANEYRRRPAARTRIFALCDAGNIINVLPESADVEAFEYKIVDDRLVITDGATISLEVNEFGANY